MILLVMRKHLLLVMGIAGSVCGAILLSLVPPMILARIIDGLTTADYIRSENDAHPAQRPDGKARTFKGR